MLYGLIGFRAFGNTPAMSVVVSPAFRYSDSRPSPAHCSRALASVALSGGQYGLGLLTMAAWR